MEKEEKVFFLLLGIDPKTFRLRGEVQFIAPQLY